MDAVFGLPAPLYDRIDAWMALALPAAVRLVAWGALAGFASIALYWLLSPQARVARAKAQALQARRALEAHDGDFASARPLLRAQLGAALRQLGLVLPGSLAGALPVLTVLVWAEARYGASRYVPFGPEWVGSWMALFLPALAASSFIVFRLARLH